LGVGGAVVLQIMSKTVAPVIVSYLLATGLAALTYRFLGGIEGSTALTIGALKLTGALAALVGIAMIVNNQLVNQVKPPSQFQLWDVSGTLPDEAGKPIEPIDIDSFALDPSSFHHPGNGKFKLTIYTSPGLAGVEFPTLKINPRGYDACLRTREGGLVESLCPQSVPTPELANDSKLLKRFGVPDGI
jgi:hypothetical protein